MSQLIKSMFFVIALGLAPQSPVLAAADNPTHSSLRDAGGSMCDGDTECLRLMRQQIANQQKEAADQARKDADTPTGDRILSGIGGIIAVAGAFWLYCAFFGLLAGDHKKKG